MDEKERGGGSRSLNGLSLDVLAEGEIERDKEGGCI